MTRTQTRAEARPPREENTDLLAQMLGGIWPAEIGLEALLDRIEARGAAQ